MKIAVTEEGIQLDEDVLITRESLRILLQYKSDDDVDLQLQLARPAATGLPYVRVDITTE